MHKKTGSLCYHGVYEEEKRLGQKFYITAELELDTRKQV